MSGQFENLKIGSQLSAKSVPVTIAPDSFTEANAAQESGGNLAQSVQLLTLMQELILTQRKMLSELRTMNAHLAQITGMDAAPLLTAADDSESILLT